MTFVLIFLALGMTFLYIDLGFRYGFILISFGGLGMGLFILSSFEVLTARKALLLRLLEQLCVRLRPWTESEREWLWGSWA